MPARIPASVAFARKVRFTENNVELKLPDGSWDTVRSEVGTALTLVDPQTGNIGMFMTIRMLDTPAYLAIRLHVKGECIDEVEYILSTKRLVSTPPEPFGAIDTFVRNPCIAMLVPPEQRSSRQQVIDQAKVYLGTLQNNTGEIRGARFSPDATRHENGLVFRDIEKDFRRGYYCSNGRVYYRGRFVRAERYLANRTAGPAPLRLRTHGGVTPGWSMVSIGTPSVRA
ncbi:MAG: hypothetical protein RL030_1879 [Pseudomonadota bacterium]